eukprot:7452512-Pyramimonas_sp.AAC.2
MARRACSTAGSGCGACRRLHWSHSARVRFARRILRGEISALALQRHRHIRANLKHRQRCARPALSTLTHPGAMRGAAVFKVFPLSC